MKGLLVAFALAVLVTVTHGLKCYTCDNAREGGKAGDCGDAFNTTSNKAILMMCNTTETFCRKEKTGLNNVYATVERACASQCEDQNLAYVKRVVCCQADGCNGSNDIKPALAMISLASAIVIALKSFF